jgi:uncharacterized protein
MTIEAGAAATHGRFLWYELMTTDMAAAKAFYGRVMGWGARDAAVRDLAYAFFTVGTTEVSGLTKLPDDMRRMGAPPRWIGYIGVDDVDAGVAEVKRLGGAVLVPPTDTAGISRFAVVADPQAAMLALVKGREPGRRQAAPLRAVGRVGWHELFAANTETAFAFYRELFGWQKGIAETGANGTYQLFAAAGETVGAMLTKPAETPPVPFWLYYFNVGDIDAAMSRVKAGGGEIVRGPNEVPDGSWIVQCTDPQQAMFALIGKRSYRAAGFLERVMAPSAN